MMECAENVDVFCYKKIGRPTVCPGDEVLRELMKHQSTSEIAKSYGVHPRTVLSWIRRAGFTPTLRHPSRRPSDDDLFAYYRDHTAAETADYYGVQQSTVYRWINEYRNARRKDLNVKNR